MPYLTRTITSHCNRKVYGYQNEEVKIIADHGSVIIVEGATRFPVPVGCLSEVRVEMEQPIKETNEWLLF